MAVDEQKRFKDIMHGLGESSSLHAVPKIVTSRQLIVKILWCILLIGAVGLFIFHFSALVKEYYSYPTKTSVNLKYAPLPFPALTFCNMNPIKLAITYSDEPTFNPITELVMNTDVTDFIDTLDDGVLRDFYLEVFTMFNYRKFNDSRDDYIAWKIRLKTEIKKLAEEDRFRAGHQLIDFVHRATFTGHRLPLSWFTPITTSDYGNCFTLDRDELIARGSGSSNSIHLVFNVDTFEYLEDFTSAYGVRMVIHEKGTYPLPDSEGITLSTKYETHIGMKMASISRLGGKYSKCSDGEEFTQEYGIKYTVPICYSICEARNVFEMCNCVPFSSEINVDSSHRICDVDNATEWICSNNVVNAVQNGSIKCGCNNRCNQIIYSTTMSGRNWPHTNYLKQVLLEEVCRRINDTSRNYTISPRFTPICQSDGNDIFGPTLDDIADNFLSVYIYYEDLNYESISEEPLYNVERFLSDIGGAMGLYLGVSCLTCVELLQVILEIILYLKKRFVKVAPHVSPTEDTNRHTNAD